MIVCFSGTRHSMTRAQQTSFETWLRSRRTPIAVFHHGDCIGADEQACEIVRSVFGTAVRIEGHPGRNRFMRAYCKCDVMHPPQENLARNHHMVNISNVLLAAPQTAEEILRSGTWATIRYARKCRPVVVINPDGSYVTVHEEMLP